MISDAIQTAIFISIPKTVAVGDDTLTVHVDYANRMTEPYSSASYPLIAIGYFADTKDVRSSPLNQMVSTEIVANGPDEDQRERKGKRKRVTLSLHCSAINESDNHRNDIVDKMISDLETWVMKSLPDALDGLNVVVIDETPIPRLDSLDGGSVAHGVFDVVLLYAFSYTEDSPNIETINDAVITAE